MRPLNAGGRNQATGLAALWQHQPLTRVLSSPFARCVETVQPLADASALPVEATPALAEGYADDAVRLVHDLIAQDAALCSHGDVIPAVLRALDRDGVDVVPAWRWEKASTWVVTADDGSFTLATYVPPPQ